MSTAKRPPLRLEAVPRSVDQSLIDHVLKLTQRVNEIDNDVVETKAVVILVEAGLSRIETRLDNAQIQPAAAARRSDGDALSVVAVARRAARESVEDFVEELRTGDIDVSGLVGDTQRMSRPQIDSERVRAIASSTAKDVEEKSELARSRKRRDFGVEVAKSVIAALIGAGLLYLLPHLFH